MRDQELRDKISDKVYEILRKSSTLQNGKRILTLDINGIEKVAERVAYSLVSIGIGDVSEWKHRAEVAEKIAREACGIVFSQEIDDEDYDDVLYEYKEQNEKYCDEIGVTDDILYDYLKEQSEKELQEEMKDE